MTRLSPASSHDSSLRILSMAKGMIQSSSAFGASKSPNEMLRGVSMKSGHPFHSIEPKEPTPLPPPCTKTSAKNLNTKAVEP